MSDNISVEEYQWIVEGLEDKNDILMILILLQEEEEEAVIASEKENFVFSRNWHVYQQTLGAEERRHHSGYIPICTLHDPISSEFQLCIGEMMMVH